MNRIKYSLVITVLWIISGCANFLYQGEITAPDSLGKERHFIIYWTKTDPLIGQAKAGPAILLTECSPATRIDFADQPEGIVFRGMPGFERLPGQTGTVSLNQICGRVTNYHSLTEAMEGSMTIRMECAPISDEFAVQPRNYLAARPEPYTFPIVEKEKKWSFTGETLPGPGVPPCREQ
jgi:hypothetical protein